MTATDAMLAHVKYRRSQGFTATKEHDGSYIIWQGNQPREVVATENDRTIAYRLPQDMDPTLDGKYLH